MRSNYRRIGDFIELVGERNMDLEIDRLLGLSITKEFIPSVANTVGTNMKKYKIIRKNQFACSIMQVRRDKKMPVAILKDYDEAIISQAYPVFRVVDETKLLPDYLMMWMSREEFDREACFLAVGGVRGSLEWEDFLDMELPVPSIEKQREIVAEYNTVVDRIELNKQINQKLEETANAIYRQWFEEFELPISKEYAESIGKPELEGKPYKSSGGEMVYNEELDKEIPKVWEVETLEHFFDLSNGKTKPKSNGDVPIYGGNGILGFANKANFSDVIVIGRVGANCGSLFRVKGELWVSDNAIAATPKKNMINFGYYLLHSLNLNNKSEGTGQPLLTQKILYPIKVLAPSEALIKLFEDTISNLFDFSQIKESEMKALQSLEQVLLSRISKKEKKVYAY